MPADIDLRAAVLGSERSRSGRGGLVAGALFVGALAAGVASRAHSLPAADGLSYVFVAAGVGLAAAYAYRNSGLLLAWALVLAPAAGGLVAERLPAAGEPAVVALPLSFAGHGAVEFWLPTALLLGTVGFGLGVLGRWSVRATTSTG